MLVILRLGQHLYHVIVCNECYSEYFGLDHVKVEEGKRLNSRGPPWHANFQQLFLALTKKNMAKKIMALSLFGLNAFWAPTYLTQIFWPHGHSSSLYCLTMLFCLHFFLFSLSNCVWDQKFLYKKGLGPKYETAKITKKDVRIHWISTHGCSNS